MCTQRFNLSIRHTINYTHFNVFYTRGIEYEDLLEEDYDLLQENLGIKIQVNNLLCLIIHLSMSNPAPITRTQ